MKYLFITLICFVTATAFSQDPRPPFDGHTWEAPYRLAVPRGWGVERFELPPFFADINYKGIEDIRFTPGWAKKENDEYWSYAFVWFLEDRMELSTANLEDALKKYYTGLLKVNSDSAKHSGEQPIEVTTNFHAAKRDKLGPGGFEGVITMRDYMSRLPITLNCKVHARLCPAGNKQVIFFELSPQAYTHAVWRSLDDLWVHFSCTK